MNPQWNTPPDGDFARYVERLAAQAMQPHRPPQEGEHGLDVGMTQRSPDAEPVHLPQAQGPSTEAGARPARHLLKAAGIAWVVVLMVLLVAGAPAGIFLGLFAAGLWLGYKFKHLFMPPGVENWKQWLEEAAKRQQQQQLQQQQRKRNPK
ncbi:hypothetical protein H4CHR_02657 [Variovorax sp. PBS-H4]|uniref:hypothetical protein n=1 Tax=Variovorax sp. PBS-H4 TaxID=434008 RepID=UPI001315F35F|nr:hypothetical protein [Variovorax sp. PBS-H4]VTU30690.1 hypothetical protein H4CHR_02657 [Variovorax sp. PBS-H4]